jgi:hypothetical protein
MMALVDRLRLLTRNRVYSYAMKQDRCDCPWNLNCAVRTYPRQLRSNMLLRQVITGNLK